MTFRKTFCENFIKLFPFSSHKATKSVLQATWNFTIGMVGSFEKKFYIGVIGKQFVQTGESYKTLTLEAISSESIW